MDYNAELLKLGLTQADIDSLMAENKITVKELYEAMTISQNVQEGQPHTFLSQGATRQTDIADKKKRYDELLGKTVLTPAESKEFEDLSNDPDVVPPDADALKAQYEADFYRFAKQLSGDDTATRIELEKKMDAMIADYVGGGKQGTFSDYLKANEDYLQGIAAESKARNDYTNALSKVDLTLSQQQEAGKYYDDLYRLFQQSGEKDFGGYLQQFIPELTSLVAPKPPPEADLLADSLDRKLAGAMDLWPPDVYDKYKKAVQADLDASFKAFSRDNEIDRAKSKEAYDKFLESYVVPGYLTEKVWESFISNDPAFFVSNPAVDTMAKYRGWTKADPYIYAAMQLKARGITNPTTAQILDETRAISLDWYNNHQDVAAKIPDLAFPPEQLNQIRQVGPLVAYASKLSQERGGPAITPQGIAAQATRNLNMMGNDMPTDTQVTEEMQGIVNDLFNQEADARAKSALEANQTGFNAPVTEGQAAQAFNNGMQLEPPAVTEEQAGNIFNAGMNDTQTYEQERQKQLNLILQNAPPIPGMGNMPSNPALASTPAARTSGSGVDFPQYLNPEFAGAYKDFIANPANQGAEFMGSATGVPAKGLSAQDTATVQGNLDQQAWNDFVSSTFPDTKTRLSVNGLYGSLYNDYVSTAKPKGTPFSAYLTQAKKDKIFDPYLPQQPNASPKVAMTRYF
jgi:hypothetical protein